MSSTVNIGSSVFGKFLLLDHIFSGANETAHKTSLRPDGKTIYFRFFRRNENEELIFYKLTSETL